MTTPEKWPMLAGRTAVVTGGASGIGAAIAHLYAQSGVTDGVVVDLPGALGRASLPAGWSGVGVDLRDDASVSAAFEEARTRLGRVDLLAAAAGIVPLWTDLGGLDPREWDDVFAVNARGVMRSIQETLPAMPDGGAIVVIASQNSWRGSQVLASYVASKHAVLGLVRSVALELGARGIRVNAIAPGSVPTEAYRGRLRRREEAGGLAVEDALAHEALGNPLGRLALPEEIAAAALFLASDLASAVTGHLLPVGAPLS
jgi:NAD(P)-dependent dehydrogenase (short-subunit alcohol dehydrogenase family)